MAWRVAKSLNQLLAEINASAPNRGKGSDGSIGDANHQSRTSDHNPHCCGWVVTARDFTHDPGGGFDAHAYADWQRLRCRGDILFNGHREVRVKYIISNRRIASPSNNWAWRQYTGSNPHDKHCHVSVDCTAEGDRMDSALPWGWAGAQQPPPAVAEEDDMFCNHGEEGNKVWVLQRQLNESGVGDPIAEDWSYGDKTAAKMVELGFAGASGAGHNYGAGEYAELQRMLREKWARDFGGDGGGGGGIEVGSAVTIVGEVTSID